MNAEFVLDRLPDAVLVLRGGRVALANSAAAALWGGDELRGRPEAELFVAGELERLALFEERRAEGWPLPPDIRLRLKRGDGVEVIANARSTQLDDGSRVLCARDVTEQSRAEQLVGDLALLASDERVLDGPEALLEGSAPVFDALGWTVAFTEVTHQGSVTLRVVAREGDPVGAYGRTLIGRHLPFAETPVLADVVRTRTARFIDFDPPRLSNAERAAVALRESMAKARTARSAWCPILQGRRVSHVLAVTGQDLTEADFVAVKMLAAQLGASIQLRKLRSGMVRSERLAAVGEMAAVLAHEVRNPLAIVFNALATLRRTTSDAERAQLIDILGDEAERLRRLASDLLDFSHPGVASPEANAVGPLIEAALEQARHEPAFGERKPVVSVEGISGEHRVWVDPLLFRRALVNLLANAFQHVPQGGRVTIALSREAEDIVLRVENDGPPIPEALRSKIFEPFFTTKPTGTGLGLAIVRRIAGDLSGSIELEDTKSGVCFALRVPAEGAPSSSLPPGLAPR